MYLPAIASTFLAAALSIRLAAADVLIRDYSQEYLPTNVSGNYIHRSFVLYDNFYPIRNASCNYTYKVLNEVTANKSSPWVVCDPPTYGFSYKNISFGDDPSSSRIYWTTNHSQQVYPVSNQTNRNGDPTSGPISNQTRVVFTSSIALEFDSHFIYQSVGHYTAPDGWAGDPPLTNFSNFQSNYSDSSSDELAYQDCQNISVFSNQQNTSSVYNVSLLPAEAWRTTPSEVELTWPEKPYSSQGDD